MIQELKGKYRPLSNFWSCFIEYDGVIYPSVENAYQAAKMANKDHRKMFEHCKASEAKQLGKTYPMRADWETCIRWPSMRPYIREIEQMARKANAVAIGVQFRVIVMYELVLQKFKNDIFLRSLLIGTGSEEIQEGNYWGDTFWGTVNGKGENWLGRILMKVREELRQQEG